MKTTFGSDQFKWHANGTAGYGDPAGPPAGTTVGGPDVSYVLPRASVKILRGLVGGM